MPNTPEKSFIPRQNTATKRRQGASRRIYIFTVLCYVLLVSTLLASAGVFLYGRVIQGQLEQEIASLNQAIEVFDVEEMKKVDEFDVRLRQAQSRIDASVSMSSIFDALEAATVQTVQISELNLERSGDQGFTLTTNLNTDGFDSSIFQRGIFERNAVIDTVSIENVSLGQSVSEDGAIIGVGSQVSLVARLGVPLTNVPFLAPNANTSSVPATTVPPVELPPEQDNATTTAEAELSGSNETVL